MPSIHDHTLYQRQGFHVSSSDSDSAPNGGAQPRWPQPGWSTHAIGRRVSVRVAAGEAAPSGRPGFRDVVGFLESATDTEWIVRTRTGNAKLIDPGAVVAAKTVPDGPQRLKTASDIDIASLERIAAAGWQPLERETLGEWSLRAAEGYTGRANSVLPLGEPGLPLNDALDAVRTWYRDRGLTPRLQMPLPLNEHLDSELAARGWGTQGNTHVMVCDVSALQMALGDVDKQRRTVSIAPTPDAPWIAAFRYGTSPIPASVTPILTKADHPVFVTVNNGNGPADDEDELEAHGIGRGAITGRWLGITAIEVAEGYRRQGLGRLVIDALARYSARLGVRHVYLQVAHDNDPALTLYRRLGFTHHHDYVYRVYRVYRATDQPTAG